MEVFDEEKAIKAIMASLGERARKYDDDDILDVIDIIWDYYEDNGFLDVSMDGDDDGSVDVETLVNHVTKMVKKDRGSRIDIADIPDIVQYELDYEALCDEL